MGIAIKPEMINSFKKPFDNKIFFVLLIALIGTISIDTIVVKVNDLIDKNFIPLQSKLILFSFNSSLCIFLQFLIIKYVTASFRADRQNKTLNAKIFYIISLASLGVLASLIGFLIFQQFYDNYYDTSIVISIIMVSYGTAAAFLVWLSLLFLSWYKSNHNLIVVLYFISILAMAFNLVVTAVFTSAKVFSLIAVVLVGFVAKNAFALEANCF